MPEWSAKERVVRARANLIQSDEPFFGLIAMRMVLKEDAACRDMWTDGQTLGYNPEYVASLKDVELKGLIAHLVMHIAAGHPWRQGERSARLWNVAADMAIAPALLDAGFVMPAGSIAFDERFRGMTAEGIYAVLEKEQEPQPENPEPEAPQETSDEDGGGDGSDAPGDDEGPTEKVSEPEVSNPVAPGEVRPNLDGSAELEMLAAIQDAVEQQGTLPGDMARVVKGYLCSQVDWREALHQFAQRCVSGAAGGYDWSRPNTRWVHRSLYLPRRQAKRLGCLVVVRDTSASIDENLLNLFMGELRAIVDSVEPERLIVLDCDARVNAVFESEGGELPEGIEKARGGGGTSFVPPFDWLKEHQIEPDGLVYLTDLLGTFPKAAGFPVLWASTSPLRQAPFGDTVYLR